MNRYRQLKSVAHNLADKFSQSCEHFAYLAISSASYEVSIDLLQETITPISFVSPRNLNLVRLCAEDIQHAVAGFSANPITSAQLFLRVVPAEAGRAPSSCITASIMDDRSRLWTASVSNSSQLIAE